MELMSPLLFCALVAHLPQALGDEQDTKFRRTGTDIKFNSSMVFHEMPMPKKILLNINGPPLVNMISDLQMVFMDVRCKKCIDCMERAIKAYKAQYHIAKTKPRTDELHQEVLNIRKSYINRHKRQSDTETAEKSTPRTKRTKSKKRTTKSVTVTRYNVEGNVYALKVKETNTHVNSETQNDTQVSTCQIYSVKKSIPCDTPEGDSFLTVAKRRVNKKNRKEREKNKAAATTTEKTTKENTGFMAPSFRKRQVDNSQVPENFMPSIEELY